MKVISGKAIPVTTLKCERPNMPKAIPIRSALIFSFSAVHQVPEQKDYDT